MTVSSPGADHPKRQVRFGPQNLVVRRVFSALLRTFGGMVLGAVIGFGVQIFSGVNGWALFGAAAGLVSVSFFLGLRDPRR